MLWQCRKNHHKVRMTIFKCENETTFIINNHKIFQGLVSQRFDTKVVYIHNEMLKQYMV